MYHVKHLTHPVGSGVGSHTGSTPVIATILFVDTVRKGRMDEGSIPSTSTPAVYGKLTSRFSAVGQSASHKNCSLRLTVLWG